MLNQTTRETHEELRQAAPARVDVLGVGLDCVSYEEALQVCERAIQTGGYVQHMAVNAAKLVNMRSDDMLRRITEDCELVTADGQAVVWASRILGTPLPERVAGIDLMEKLLEMAASKGYRVYLLGARQEVLEAALDNLRARFPRLIVAGARDGYFSDEEEQEVADEIGKARPDMLFVAMSSPRKEYFLGRHGTQMGVPFVMGVGGSIDVVAGATRRAPASMQRLGLEWLYRLLQEPRRLLGRYARTNGRFIALLTREVARRQFRS